MAHYKLFVYMGPNVWSGDMVIYASVTTAELVIIPMECIMLLSGLEFAYII